MIGPVQSYPLDYDMTDTNSELWTFMSQIELEFLALRELDWKANWYEITPELRERIERLNLHQS